MYYQESVQMWNLFLLKSYILFEMEESFFFTNMHIFGLSIKTILQFCIFLAANSTVTN